MNLKGSDVELGYIDMAQFLKESLSNIYDIEISQDHVTIHKRKGRSSIELPLKVHFSPSFVSGCGLCLAEARKGAQESTSSFYGMDLSPADAEFLHMFINWTMSTFKIETFSAEIGYDQKIELELKKYGLTIDNVKERFLEEFPMIRESSLNLYKRKEHKGGLTFTICFREPGKTRPLLDVATVLSVRIFEFVNEMIAKPGWLKTHKDIATKPFLVIDAKKWVNDFRYGKEPGLHDKIAWWISKTPWREEKTGRYVILREERNQLALKKQRGRNVSNIFREIPLNLGTLTQAALYVGEGMTNSFAMTNKDPRVIVAFLNYVETISPNPHLKWGTEVRVWWFFDCISDSIRDEILKLLKNVNERHERTEMVNQVLYHVKKELYRKLELPLRKRPVRKLNFEKISEYEKEAMKLETLMESHREDWIDLEVFHQLKEEILTRIKKNLDFSEGGIRRPWLHLSLKVYERLNKYPSMRPFVVPAGLNTDYQEGIARKEYIGLRVRGDSTLNELFGKCQTGPQTNSRSLSFSLLTDLGQLISQFSV